MCFSHKVQAYSFTVCLTSNLSHQIEQQGEKRRTRTEKKFSSSNNDRGNESNKQRMYDNDSDSGTSWAITIYNIHVSAVYT